MTSNKIALALLSWIKNVLEYFGIEKNTLDKWDEFIFLIIIIVISFIIGGIIYFVIAKFARKLLEVRSIRLLKELIRHNTIKKTSALVPPLIIASLLPFAFSTKSNWFILSEKITWIYFLIVLILTISAISRSITNVIHDDQKWQNKPIKSIIELTRVLFFVIVFIVIISIILDKSPLTLITGLGAFAAVIMLIFKDTIVGFVSGVLLSENDMIHIGDWIEMPNSPVNGVVQDITLDTVKIQRFDNTIVTVPPYTLISQPFINWIGMTESGGRRIASSYNIKLDYIKKCTPEFLEKMKGFDDELADYITKKQQQESEGKTANTENPDGLMDGTIDTNLGLFRAYMAMYIRRNKNISKDLLFMVYTLEPTENGIPLQIYCFSANKNWKSYESIKSEILEHFVYSIPFFELYPYQNAGSRDYIISACLESNREYQNLNGVPWDTFKDNPLKDNVKPDNKVNSVKSLDSDKPDNSTSKV